MEPWQDYLVLPVAPVVIATQIWALAGLDRRRGLLLSAAGCVAIAAMFAAVALVDRDRLDANIGAGLLLLDLVAAFALFAARAGRPAKK